MALITRLRDQPLVALAMLSVAALGASSISCASEPSSWGGSSQANGGLELTSLENWTTRRFSQAGLQAEYPSAASAGEAPGILTIAMNPVNPPRGVLADSTFLIEIGFDHWSRERDSERRAMIREEEEGSEGESRSYWHWVRQWRDSPESYRGADYVTYRRDLKCDDGTIVWMDATYTTPQSRRAELAPHQGAYEAAIERVLNSVQCLTPWLWRNR